MDDSTIPAQSLQEIKVTIFSQLLLIGTLRERSGLAEVSEIYDCRLAIADLQSAAVFNRKSPIGNRQCAPVFAPIEPHLIPGQVRARQP